MPPHIHFLARRRGWFLTTELRLWESWSFAAPVVDGSLLDEYRVDVMGAGYRIATVRAVRLSERELWVPELGARFTVRGGTVGPYRGWCRHPDFEWPLVGLKMDGAGERRGLAYCCGTV